MYKEGKIHWLKIEEGGLKAPPTQDVCYAVTCLPQINPSWWSIKIFLLEPNEYISDCEVSFLFEHAPHDILELIDYLDVYDGPRKVATIYFSLEKKEFINQKIKIV